MGLGDPSDGVALRLDKGFTQCQLMSDDGLDENGLAACRLRQAKALLGHGRFVENEDRGTAHDQRYAGHDQDQEKDALVIAGAVSNDVGIAGGAVSRGLRLTG